VGSIQLSRWTRRCIWPAKTGSHFATCWTGAQIFPACGSRCSGCQTGLTKFERVPDEVIGLPAGFLQAGGPGVVATLWPVNDLSTAVLVAEFYRFLLAKQIDAATALSRARGYLRDATRQEPAEWFERRYDDSGGTDRVAYEAAADLRSHPDPANRPYADPLYWAGFVYTGP